MTGVRLPTLERSLAMLRSEPILVVTVTVSSKTLGVDLTFRLFGRGQVEKLGGSPPRVESGTYDTLTNKVCELFNPGGRHHKFAVRFGGTPTKLVFWRRRRGPV